MKLLFDMLTQQVYSLLSSSHDQSYRQYLGLFISILFHKFHAVALKLNRLNACWRDIINEVIL